jgi:hypothetical protein
MIKLRDILNEIAKPFGDRFGKKRWVNLSTSDIDAYADEIAELIVGAYASKGGNFEVSNGDDLRKSDVKYWIADDVDEDPNADAALGGRETTYGVKMTMMGQDGSPEGKQAAMFKMLQLMKTRGFYAELDLALAQKLNIPTIKDLDTIKQVLAGKEIKDYNASTGEYTRLVSGAHMHKKVLVGVPKV